MQSNKLDIVLIVAGLSKRMGGEQKVLHPFNGETLLYYSLTSALLSGDVVLVTGHNRTDVEKEAYRIRDSRSFTNSLMVVYNSEYEKGQYTSTICGIEQLSGDKPFALSLGDMPFILPSDYSALGQKLNGFDVLRPFVEGKPAHPVFFKRTMRDFFLQHKGENSVRSLLDNYKDILKIDNLDYTENKKIVVDFDYEIDFKQPFDID